MNEGEIGAPGVYAPDGDIPAAPAEEPAAPGLYGPPVVDPALIGPVPTEPDEELASEAIPAPAPEVHPLPVEAPAPEPPAAEEPQEVADPHQVRRALTKKQQGSAYRFVVNCALYPPDGAATRYPAGTAVTGEKLHTDGARQGDLAYWLDGGALVLEGGDQ